MKYTDLSIEPGGDGSHLTERQEWIWQWMLGFQEKNQRPATIREILKATGLSAHRSLNSSIMALVRKGFVEKESIKSRTTVAIDPIYVPTEKGLEACA